MSEFWQWTDLFSYFQATILIAICSFVVLSLGYKNPYVVEGIGFASLLIESFLAMPQFLKNLKSRSVHGMK
jgi:hypothetical protein